MAKTKKFLTLLINNKMVIKSKKDYSMNLLFYLKSGGKTDRQDRHRERDKLASTLVSRSTLSGVTPYASSVIQ